MSLQAIGCVLCRVNVTDISCIILYFPQASRHNVQRVQRVHDDRVGAVARGAQLLRGLRRLLAALPPLLHRRPRLLLYQHLLQRHVQHVQGRQ